MFTTNTKKADIAAGLAFQTHCSLDKFPDFVLRDTSINCLQLLGCFPEQSKAKTQRKWFIQEKRWKIGKKSSTI
jgi:hypothetical protein